MPRSDTRKERDLKTIERPNTDRPHQYEVLLHNDDYTTQDFVVIVLKKFFHHTAVSARKIMLEVHNHGVGVAGTFPRDIAETKAYQVVEFARQNEMPLQASLRRQE